MNGKSLRIAALCLITALMVIFSAVAAAAGDYAKGGKYAEKRSGYYGALRDDGTVLEAKGGAAGVFVADGLAVEGEGLAYDVDASKNNEQDASKAVGAALNARWHFARGSKGSAHVGLGAGAMVSDYPLTGELGREALSNQAEMGVSMALKKNVSLQAAGRYQRLGDPAAPGMETVGGNFGVKISF